MPKYPGVFAKQLKSGVRYYGAKWYNGKTHVTPLCDTAGEAADARRKLGEALHKAERDEQRREA